MTRIDMTTREWHELIKPVLPHASTDTDLPELCSVRLECSRQVLFAVATDRYTLGASRHVLDEVGSEFVIHVERTDAANMLRLFPYTKDSNPELRITVDKVSIPVGRGPSSVEALGLTVESEDGTRLLLHDRRNPLMPDSLHGWRKLLAQAVFRDLAPAAASLLLTPQFMGRWASAVRAGERAVFLAGPKSTDLILILVEEHFAGIWKPAGHLDTGTDELLTGSPWRYELASALELADATASPAA